MNQHVAGSTVAVTGAFGFTGRALAERLLANGCQVVSLARRVERNDPLASRLTMHPLDFGAPDELARALAGVDVLYNTYWLRFPRDGSSFEGAVANSVTLFDAARVAGVRRIVHLSVVNADLAAGTPYVRAKALVELLLADSGLSHAIVRPTLTFGPGDILVNNLAWALRHLPAYGLAGRGRYRIQPVHVDDVARIAVEAAAEPDGSVIDAAGPEQLEFRELVALVRTAVGSRSVVVPMPDPLVLLGTRILGRLVGDVVLTRDELAELTSSLLVSHTPARGTIRISEWLQASGGGLGRRWSSELARNYGRA
jgi:NADH dehydrogenase